MPFVFGGVGAENPDSKWRETAAAAFRRIQRLILYSTALPTLCRQRGEILNVKKQDLVRPPIR